jgi:hypothetical protein
LKHLNPAVLTVLLAIVALASCRPASSAGEKKVEIINKENEFEKKDFSAGTENELLKQEQELNQKYIKQATLQQSPRDTVKDNLDFLKKFSGKYPNEVKLLDNTVLKKRLKKLLGPQYDYLKSIWEVETAIEVEYGLFYAWGMKAHSGGDPGAVIMADIVTNVLYVGIRKDQNEKIYSEDDSEIPQRLKDWANEQ